MVQALTISLIKQTNHEMYMHYTVQLHCKQAQPSWDRLREAQLSSSVYSQISFAQKGQLREALSSQIQFSQISFAQKP